MNKVFISTQVVEAAAQVTANEIVKDQPALPVYRIFGVPRGGIPAAYAVSHALSLYHKCCSTVVDKVEQSNVIVDDLYDSGATWRRYENHSQFFYTLFDKRDQYTHDWLVFPWEAGEHSGDTSADDIVVRLLQRLGEDPTREGLRETPARYVKALEHWFSGYKVEDPLALLKAFQDGAEGADGGLVVVGDIPVYSHCEHHIAPIFGTATIGYIPQGRIVGLSKMKRVVDAYARRLQVQERMTRQVADAINFELKPRGVGVVLKCRHMCMESRGVETPGSYTVTSALRGVLLDNAAARAEFMSLVK
jgi:GTP cyclohydrolase I